MPSPTAVIVPEDVQESEYPLAPSDIRFASEYLMTIMDPSRGVEINLLLVNEGEKVAILIDQGAAHAAAEVEQVADLLGRRPVQGSEPSVLGALRTGHLRSRLLCAGDARSHRVFLRPLPDREHFVRRHPLTRAGAADTRPVASGPGNRAQTCGRPPLPGLVGGCVVKATGSRVQPACGPANCCQPQYARVAEVLNS